MFFQLIIAILFGFSSPKQINYTNSGNNAVATNRIGGEIINDIDTGGEGSQVIIPK